MPVITFEAGKLDREQKKQLAREFTEVASRVTGLPEAGFYVYLKENDPGNIGVGGKLLDDKKEEE